ncbi:MAG: DUF4412 domain-containing protein [Lentisphaeria bacterium]|mgnify:CR=1 FL=1|nr:DUF4412 domain-containing protein [Lentisphaeria bacterium]
MRNWLICFIMVVFAAHAQTEPGGMMLKDFGKLLGLPEEFSAQVEISAGGEEAAMVMNSRMFVSKSGMRYEMEMPGGFGTMTTLALTEGETTKIYMLSPNQKVYTELPPSPRQVYTEEQYKIDDVGTDTVNGISCQKKNLTDPNGKVISIWLKKGDNLPVKCLLEEKGMQVSMVFKDFKPGKVDPELLKIPADYKKGSPLSGFMNLKQ